MKWILLSISMFFCQSSNITFSTLWQARPLLDERNLDKLVDLQLGSTYNVCQMQAMISAAALCVQQSSQRRPQISQVGSFPKKIRKSRLMHQNTFNPLPFAYPKAVIAKAWFKRSFVQENLCHWYLLSSLNDDIFAQPLLNCSCMCFWCMCVHCLVNMQVLKMLGKDSDGEGGLSTRGDSKPVHIADTTYINHRAHNSATSCMSEINSTRSGFGCN